MSAESSDLRSALAKMLKEDFNIDMAEAGEDKQALIKQIQDLMAQINGDNENPEPEVAQALQDAQTAIDTANAAQAEKEKEIGANQDQEDADTGAAMTANAQAATQTANGIDAQGNNVTMPNGINPETGTPTTPVTQAGQAAPANQTFGQAFKAARASGAKEFDYKGKKYSTAQKGENPALDAAMKPKAPTAPTPPTPPAQAGQAAPAGQTPSGVKLPPAAGSFSADMDARKKATQPAWMKQNENVGYNEDQTLARIINLANIR
jgi:hypothetical protein